MKTPFKRTLIIAVSVLTIFQACTKEKKTEDAPDNKSEIGLTTAKATSDVFFDDVSQEVIQANTESGLTIRETQACATITISPQGTTFPKTVTIDFGTGCTGTNGFVRKGKLIYTISKKFINPGAQIAVSFDGYSVNDYKLEGTYTIKNNGSFTGLNITTTLVDGKITYPDGTWYTRSSVVTWVQAKGADTPLDFSNDEFNITGSGTVKSSTGNELTAASETPLLRKFTCYNTVSGKLNLAFNNITGVLDYGAGECDKAAILTIGNKEYDVTLP